MEELESQGVGVFPRGAEGMRANRNWELPRRSVPRSQVISGTASTTVARMFPIPVTFERT